MYSAAGTHTHSLSQHNIPHRTAHKEEEPASKAPLLLVVNLTPSSLPRPLFPWLVSGQCFGTRVAIKL